MPSRNIRGNGNTSSKEVEEFDVKFKLVIIGESTVGKTCITKRLVDNEFTVSMMSTIGLDFAKKSFNVDDCKVLLNIWDTAGQERFHSVTTSVYRNAKGIILVYDVTNRDSFEKIETYWLRSLQINLEDPLPMFLIGNKVDLVENQVVSTAEGENLKDQQFFRCFFETSAKSGENIFEAFHQIAAHLVGWWAVPQQRPLSGLTVFDTGPYPAAAETLTTVRLSSIEDHNNSKYRAGKYNWIIKAPRRERKSFKLHDRESAEAVRNRFDNADGRKITRLHCCT